MVRTKLSLSLAVLCALATGACGKGSADGGVDSGPANLPITVGAYALKPQSGLVYQSADGGKTVVIVSDQPDICAFYQASQCKLGQVGPPPGNNLFLVFSGAAPGQYPVAEAANFFINDPGPALPPYAPVFKQPPPSSVQVGLAVVGVPGPTQFWGAVGSVTVQSNASGAVPGSYDVTLKTKNATFNNAPTIAGDFLVRSCANLGAVADFEHRCTSELSDGGLHETCSCEGKTSSATCSFEKQGNQTRDQCECTPPSGATHHCTSEWFPPGYHPHCCPLELVP